MAITNSERLGKALDLPKEGFRPCLERELKATYKDRWLETAQPSFPDWEQGKTAPDHAVRACLTVIERNPEAVVEALRSS